jgi:D-amino-acid dehydrogenase
VIGVTSAWFLAEAGHEVEVLERQPGVARETSFANAGEVSPGYASPWAGPGVPLKAVKWLLMHHGPLVLRPALDPAMWVFIARMLRNCTAARYAHNKSRMVPLAEYSRDVLQGLRATTGIVYDEASLGTLQLFRTSRQVDHAADDIAVLKQFNVPYEVLDPAGCIAAEPALAAVREKIAGGLRLPGDETGDCQVFTERLAALAAEKGVRFRFGTTIDRLVVEGGAVTGVATSAGVLSADAVIVALGS